MEFCKHIFILIDADEYAVNYMENHADEFPQANIQCVMPKFRRLMQENFSEVKLMMESADRRKTGQITFEVFKYDLRLFFVVIILSGFCVVKLLLTCIEKPWHNIDQSG